MSKSSPAKLSSRMPRPFWLLALGAVRAHEPERAVVDIQRLDVDLLVLAVELEVVRDLEPFVMPVDARLRLVDGEAL